MLSPAVMEPPAVAPLEQQAAASVPVRTPRQSSLHGWLASLVVHVAVILVLSAWFIVEPPKHQATTIAATFLDASDAATELALLSDPRDTAAEMASDLSPAPPEGPLVDQAPVPIPEIALNLAEWGISAAEPPSGLQGASANRSGNRRGKQGPPGSDFFGIKATGGTFVYVVDCSASMGDRGKFDRVRQELVRSLEHLTPDQRYFVVFFNDGTYPMEAPTPVAATPEQIDETKAWIHQFQPHGSTVPLDALLLALSFHPDAIFFLTDGAFAGYTIVDVRKHNDRDSPIPIHSISFVGREGAQLLRTMSELSGGKYRHIR